MTDDPLSMWDSFDPDDEWTEADEEHYQAFLRSPEGIALVIAGMELAESERETIRAKRLRDDSIYAAYREDFTPEEIAKECGISLEEVNFVIRNHTPSRRPTKKKGA
jgi:DNA-directed RNA polymerase specialized sigma24 family protein